MLQELFKIPILDIPIYGYGLMMVVAFVVSIQIGQALCRRVGINTEHFVNTGMIALVAGIVGARLSHVIENLPAYTRADLSGWQNFLNAVNIRSGGLTFYGGFLLATPLCIGYALRKKVPVLRGMDVIAICLMVALGFGRIGCFLNGCCYGGQCSLPWAVHFPYNSVPYQEQFYSGQLQNVPSDLIVQRADGQFELKSKDELLGNPTALTEAADQHSLGVHPAQLYSTLTAFLIAGICFAYLTLRPRAGEVFALMMLIEGPSRFLLEMLRVEPPVVHVFGFGLSLSMVLGAMIGLAGAMMWLGLRMFSTSDRSGELGVLAG